MTQEPAQERPAEAEGAPFRAVFARALQGHPCAVVGIGAEEQRLPVGSWLAEADEADESLLAHCAGPTIDIGCGPGRLTARLTELGHPALGVDVVAEAVRQTRSRGASAIVRDVFDRVPGEGRWETALLADGNIGIGGDPAALLCRVRDLVAPGGRVVLELAPPGGGVRTWRVSLECGDVRSRPFRWATVTADAVDGLADAVGLEVREPPHRHDARWCAVLGRPA